MAAAVQKRSSAAAHTHTLSLSLFPKRFGPFPKQRVGLVCARADRTEEKQGKAKMNAVLRKTISADSSTSIVFFHVQLVSLCSAFAVRCSGAPAIVGAPATLDSGGHPRARTERAPAQPSASSL
jgi:hypothetical protein